MDAFFTVTETPLRSGLRKECKCIPKAITTPWMLCKVAVSQPVRLINYISPNLRSGKNYSDPENPRLNRLNAHLVWDERPTVNSTTKETFRREFIYRLRLLTPTDKIQFSLGSRHIGDQHPRTHMIC